MTVFGEGMLFGHHLCGRSPSDIADLFCLSRPAVATIVERAAARAAGTLTEPARGGATPEREEKKRDRQEAVAEVLFRKDDDGHFVASNVSDVARILLEEGVDLDVTVRTLQRDASELGCDYVSRPRTSDLTAARMQVRLDMLPELRAHDPSCLIFSDECWLSCSDMGRKQWRRPNEAVEPRRIARWSATVHLWGAIGIGVSRLVILPPGEMIDSASYIDTLRQFLLPVMDRSRHILVQDNAPAHKAQTTRDWLQKRGVRTAAWPPYSPDLNPVETIWSWLKRHVHDIGCRQGCTREELEDCIMDAWDLITRDEIDALAGTFSAKLRRCELNGGDDCELPTLPEPSSRDDDGSSD